MWCRSGKPHSNPLIPRWRGLCLVAGDGSSLRFGLRINHVPHAAMRDQLAFCLHLPGADLMLAGALRGPLENERQMLFEQLDRLGHDDLLLLDRGNAARWLVAALNQRSIRFCMRVVGSGYACVHDLLRSGEAERMVILTAPNRSNAADYDCPATPQTMHLIRHLTPNSQVSVLMSNLLDSAAFPATLFGDLYHQRWRIEEAFKRLKCRLNLEHVSGLSHLAVAQDFAARVLCDNLQVLTSLAAQAMLKPIRCSSLFCRCYRCAPLGRLICSPKPWTGSRKGLLG
ncbi:hypothetical protein GCM10007907_12620 [Chitinimonas prasina]|uniref:Transposase IS4-like domain-containing protein n=1 Tax=Chitinimonas prasina TaxID=1434937 RepID=A0ABQ5YDF6_9NEIS|nr:transposase [Chitinimonas prasina]GLR12472.1 hypothetical protein GCM10007907_12620 [Chitinimonas prasina]